MTVLFITIVIFDGWMDGSLTSSTTDNKDIQGSVFCILTPVAIISSILLASRSYWLQFIQLRQELVLPVLLTFTLLSLFIYQYLNYGTSGILANCGVNCFSILYLGLLSGFCVAIRIEFGLWPLLMFVFVVKSADIGAYSFGTMFGKHKFSPKISPGKTWEGMAGAIAAAIIVAIGFAAGCDIMVWWVAVAFGLCFAFIGQLGDLAESMMKRDAEKIDSANKVPGFGGVLDIIDSPLVAAPFAYLFFTWCS